MNLQDCETSLEGLSMSPPLSCHFLASCPLSQPVCTSPHAPPSHSTGLPVGEAHPPLLCTAPLIPFPFKGLSSGTRCWIPHHPAGGQCKSASLAGSQHPPLYVRDPLPAVSLSEGCCKVQMRTRKGTAWPNLQREGHQGEQEGRTELMAGPNPAGPSRTKPVPFNSSKELLY